MENDRGEMKLVSLSFCCFSCDLYVLCSIYIVVLDFVGFFVK